MTILLPTLGLAFAAFVMWLGVRVVNRRERWAKWALTVAIVGMPVLYVASFGPACWVTSRLDRGNHLVTLVYGSFVKHSPRELRNWLDAYSNRWAAENWGWRTHQFTSHWLPIRERDALTWDSIMRPYPWHMTELPVYTSPSGRRPPSPSATIR